MDLKFGLTMTLMGMGVTLITLLILMGVIRLLSKVFPYKKESDAGKEDK